MLQVAYPERSTIISSRLSEEAKSDGPDSRHDLWYSRVTRGYPGRRQALERRGVCPRVIGVLRNIQSDESAFFVLMIF